MARERTARYARNSRDDRDPRDADVQDDERDEQTEDETFDDGRADGRARRRPKGKRSSPRLSVADAADIALRQIGDLTAKPPEGVTSVEPSDNGTWIVAVEILEDRHVPSSSDVLALYEAEIDADGTLLSYHRVRRYIRSKSSEGP